MKRVSTPVGDEDMTPPVSARYLRTTGLQRQDTTTLPFGVSMASSMVSMASTRTTTSSLGRTTTSSLNSRLSTPSDAGSTASAPGSTSAPPHDLPPHHHHHHQQHQHLPRHHQPHQHSHLPPQREKAKSDSCVASLSDDTRHVVQDAAERANSAMLREADQLIRAQRKALAAATSAPSPSLDDAGVVDTRETAAVFQSLARPDGSAPAWERLQPGAPPRHDDMEQMPLTASGRVHGGGGGGVLPRIFAVRTVQTSIEELMEVLAPKHKASMAVLLPGIAESGTVDRVEDRGDRVTVIKSVRMHANWCPAVALRREFMMVMSHRSMQTPDGRRGRLTSFHSVTWPSCAPTTMDIVRGSMYRTGIVAMESKTAPGCLEVVAIGEINLKGQASVPANAVASHTHVLAVLRKLTQALERNAAVKLSLMSSRVYDDIRALLRDAECETCAVKLPDAAPAGEEPFNCRKCCASVCGPCSEVVAHGGRRVRLCIECWADATLN